MGTGKNVEKHRKTWRIKEKHGKTQGNRGKRRKHRKPWRIRGKHKKHGKTGRITEKHRN